MLKLNSLSDYNAIIDNIIADLNIYNYSFDIKLILTEALTNAFNHGNKNDSSKPVYITYYFDGENIEFQILDSGNNLKNINIPEQVSDEDLLNEHGRGLFLINQFSDKVKIKNNTLIIQKKLISNDQEGCM